MFESSPMFWKENEAVPNGRPLELSKLIDFHCVVSYGASANKRNWGSVKCEKLISEAP